MPLDRCVFPRARVMTTSRVVDASGELRPALPLEALQALDRCHACERRIGSVGGKRDIEALLAQAEHWRLVSRQLARDWHYERGLERIGLFESRPTDLPLTEALLYGT